MTQQETKMQEVHVVQPGGGTKVERVEITPAPPAPADFGALANVQVAGGIDLLTAARAFASSGMFADITRVSQALTKIIAGHELNIPPFASMTGFHAIPRKRKVNRDGRDVWVEEIEISMSANLRASIIQRDPNIELDIVELTGTACEVRVAKRFAGKWVDKGSVRFTIEDAQRVKVPAGQGQTKTLTDRNMWKNFPADMLFAAVMRRIAKRHAPHLFIGDGIRGRGEDDELIAATEDAAAAHVESDSVVEADIVDDLGADLAPAASTDGDAGAEVSASSDEAEARGPSEPKDSAPDVADETLFSDEPSGEDVPDEEPVYVGLVPIYPAPDGPHEPAQDTKDRIKSTRVGELRILLTKLSLVEGALEAVFKARYGFPVTEATHEQADAFEAWINEATQTKAIA